MNRTLPRFRLPVRILAPALLAMLTTTRALPGPWPDLPGGGNAFRTFFVTWTDNGSPEMFEFLEEARPEIVQVGFYGPMFHGYAYHEKSKGYPMRLPVTGEREALERQAEINHRIHELGLRVVGHFQMCNVVGRMEDPYGFPTWYDEHWDEEILGPKPTADVRNLLQRDAEGQVLERSRYIDFQGLCISSPHARDLLKRMVRVAVEAGVDGLMSNYNYRWGCACPWCQREFKAYLGERYDAASLREKFGIENLETHRFETIPARIPGYPDPETADELEWAAMDWGARHFKQVFDEILIDYGRSLKPDLMIGTWNHIGLVGHREERSFTPIEDWHRGENYFWYSGSHGSTDLAAHKAGDAWLNLLWLREMAAGKPFMIGKYEAVRIRSSLAEAAALGGGGAGLYHRFNDPVGRAMMTRHHRFMRDRRALFEGARPLAEVGLVLPRQTLLARHAGAYEAFRALGQTLAEKHILFDVLLDQRMTTERLSGYRTVILPGVRTLSSGQRKSLRAHVAEGGRLVAVGPLGDLDLEGHPFDDSDLAQETGGPETENKHVRRLPAETSPNEVLEVMASVTQDEPLSRIEAPWTVRAAGFRQPGRRLVHLVNYNRDESAAKGHRGPAGELPIPTDSIKVHLALPENVTVRDIALYSPDREDMLRIPFECDDRRVRFTVPEVEVYSIATIEIETP